MEKRIYLLTELEINAIKELIYNEIDERNGIENINEDIKSVLEKLQTTHE